MAKIDWKKHHRFQRKPGWCGPATIQMVLFANGIKKKQRDIAKETYKAWWGTNQQMMVAYLSKFFKIVNYKHNSTTTDILFHLNKGNIVVVDWMDDMDYREPEGGHYCIVGDYDEVARMLTLVDPSNARQGIWNIAAKDFKEKWFDSIDLHDKLRVEGWMLWVDPKSKIEPDN